MNIWITSKTSHHNWSCNSGHGHPQFFQFVFRIHEASFLWWGWGDGGWEGEIFQPKGAKNSSELLDHPRNSPCQRAYYLHGLATPFFFK